MSNKNCCLPTILNVVENRFLNQRGTTPQTCYKGWSHQHLGTTYVTWSDKKIRKWMPLAMPTVAALQWLIIFYLVYHTIQRSLSLKRSIIIGHDVLCLILNLHQLSLEVIEFRRLYFSLQHNFCLTTYSEAPLYVYY